VTSYVDYLPPVFRQEVEEGAAAFLEQFLRGFEYVLTGGGDPADPGLEERLEGIPGKLAGSERYFEPGWEHESPLPPGDRTPADFLDWLGGWVALSFRADLGDPAEREALQRELIAKAVWLYGLRGTREGLEELLAIYTRLGVTVVELDTRWQVGIAAGSRLGLDTYLDAGAPHFFHVIVRLPEVNPRRRARLQRLADAIVAAEKPAHTHYRLEIAMKTMQLGVEGRSTLGVDTLLGETFTPDEEGESWQTP
jgi:phage tail-like protein